METASAVPVGHAEIENGLFSDDEATKAPALHHSHRAFRCT